MLRRSSPCTCLSLIFGALLACSSDDTPPDIENPTPDAGQEIADSGVESDAGMPDSGVMEGCNPVDGTGCMEADRFCVLQRDVNEGQCRELIDTVELGQQCSLLQQNCEAGQACSFFNGDDNAICRKVCRRGNQQDCQPLGADFDCTIFSSEDHNFGFCTSTAPQCDPLDPASCPDPNETCGLQLSALSCLEVGTSSVGQSCAQENCAAGGVCLSIADVNNGEQTCYQPCDGNTSCVLASHGCVSITLNDAALLSACVPN